MKIKRLLFQLILISGVFLVTKSCRHEILAENYAINQNRLPLNATVISLNQSKHKNKILQSIAKAESILNDNIQKKLNGKPVDFGDNIIINTDYVIYIENGPNYHTYTFNIERKNPALNAPVENLILTPLPDGTYMEFLAKYNISEQEKQSLLRGISFDSKGKVKIIRLQKGTFNNGNFLTEKSGQSCNWVEETIWDPCTSGQHDASNFAECEYIDNLQNGHPPLAYTVVQYRCESFDDGTGNSGGGSTGTGGTGSSWSGAGGDSGGTGGGGGATGGSTGDSGDGDCSGTRVYTSPKDPSYDLGTGCNDGFPTLPNLGNPKNETPCSKIKNQRNDDNFSKRIDTLQAKTGLKKENGYIQKFGGDYVYKNNASATDDANSLSLPPVATNTYIKGFMHTHVNNYSYTDTNGDTIERLGIKVFSPADVAYFMDLVNNAQTKGKILSDVYGVMVSSGVNYQIRFAGNQYQIKTFTDEQTETFKQDYIKYMKNFLNKPKKLELRFLQYISEKMNIKGVSLYRMNSDGTSTEITLNSDKTDTVENNCPN